MSHPSFTGDDSGEEFVAVGFVTRVAIPTGVGNCKLLQTVCKPPIGSGVVVAYPEPAGLRLGEETVGLTKGLNCDMLLLESMVGVFVISHIFEPSGMRAYD